METSSSTTVEEQIPQHQVFISFRGADVRLKLVSHLVKDLKLNNINVFIDEFEKRGQPIDILLKRIAESKIALVIFSGNYTNSMWCVRELEKIKDCKDEGTLVAIPIFYKLEPSTVRDLKGKFGDSFRSLAKGDERKEKWEEAFNLIPDIMGIIIDKTRELVNHCLPACLLEELLTSLKDPQTGNVEDPFEKYKDELLKRKVRVILDDVSKREQIDALLGRRDWISEGSRIVIATSDMSLTKDLAHDTYMVQNLNHRDSLQLFLFHAFGQSNPPKEDLIKLSEEFVRYTRGHPQALELLAGELQGQEKNIKIWKSKLTKLTLSLSPCIRSVFQVIYDDLSPKQKEAFLDIACFRSQEKDYIESLLASSEPESAEAISAVKALTNKFLINTCDGRVEMHDILYTFSREIDSKDFTQDGSRQRRLWLHKELIEGCVINVLQNKMNAANVRGILDLSEVEEETSLDCDHFINMGNLRYLKFYNSHCPQECRTNNKINIPDKLKLPLKEVRCLHWLKFQLEELPEDFNPANLVDLKLPYSEIIQLWEGDKDTSSLKWVDLNHSRKLCSLLGLSQAQNLQKLNLEGCTALKTLPRGMRKMKRLAFLNLKGCRSLESLPKMSLISLKTLTLSGCSNFKKFPSVSENIETLYLDGTAISQLPTNMEKLQRLVVLNMKNCKFLEEIPDRVAELKALQELILSDCLNLKIFPEIKMSSLNILLLDGTAIEAMPQLPSLQYLCLSRNAKISCLPAGISQLSQLKWLDLKYCTSLASVPEFPPNLQCLDAHGCSSLRTVSKPLARIMPTEQNHSTFIFTNCKNLEQAAKEEIISYAQRKCQLLSYARKRYNGGLVTESLFSTYFPGCEVPSWFCHETVGSELEVKLLPHWHDKKLAGIALCAVVSCLDRQDQISRLSVTCTFKVKDEDKSWIPFTCPAGSWTRHEDGKGARLEDRKDEIKSDHVFIGYTSCPHTIKCPEDGNSDRCNPTEASLKFTVTGSTSEKEKFEVLKCGLSLVYARDKNKHSSHEAKYDMLVEKSVQETSEGVNGGGKKKKKTISDDGKPNKKRKSERDDNIPC